MQKQKLTAEYFLAIQATYEGIEFALCKNGQAVTICALTKYEASRLLIPMLDQLCKEYKLTIPDLAFIAVNQGPGPFTTLRTVLATVNGLAFASGIPLLGVDGLAAFLDEVCTDEITVVMLNAFNKDVYFAISLPDGATEYGCKSGADLITQLARQFLHERVTIAGNGVELWCTELQTAFGQRLCYAQTSLSFVSITQVAKVAYAQWQIGNQGESQLMPIYLKQYSATLVPHVPGA